MSLRLVWATVKTVTWCGRAELGGRMFASYVQGSGFRPRWHETKTEIGKQSHTRSLATPLSGKPVSSAGADGPA